MTEAELIKQLKSLKAVGANTDWKNSNRDLLISQIKGQAKPAEASFGKKAWYGVRASMPTSVKNLVYKPVGAISLVIVIVLGVSVFSVSASKGSVPGDILYKVKLTSEKVQAGLTINDGKKTDLYMDFADERLNEVDKLQREPKKPEEQKENIKVAIGEFKKQMGSVKNQLEKVKEKPKPAQEVVEVARKVDEKVEELSNKIDQKTEELKDIVEEEEIKEAKDAIEETSDAAIDVIIEKHITGEVESSVEELAGKIEKKIQKAEENIGKTEEEVQVLMDKAEEEADTTEDTVEVEAAVATEDTVLDESQTDSIATEDTVEQSEAEIEETAESKEQVLGNVEDQQLEAKRLVEEAKQLLEQGDISTAFDKLRQSNIITKEVQILIDSIESDPRFETIENTEQVPAEQGETDSRQLIEDQAETAETSDVDQPLNQ